MLPGLVQEEAHAGRELVISETHGALSTNLRLLEQQAREIRHQVPALYDLAVSANSRLRETLTLSQPGQDSSTTLQNLQAPVMTLARAVGAKAEVVVTVETLSPSDRDLARLVLNDLVGNALNAGAGRRSRHHRPRRTRGRHLSYRRRSPDGPGGMEDSGHEFGAAGGTSGGTLRLVELRSGVEHQDGDRPLGGQ